MSSLEIDPALEPEEWASRRSGALAIETVGDELHVVITESNDTGARVSGPEELFALIALGNEALPEGDPRRITLHSVFDVRVGAEMVRAAGNGAVAERLAALANVLAALLRPMRDDESSADVLRRA